MPVKRPTSLTVVSILMMILGGFGLLGVFNSMRVLNDPKFAEIAERLRAASALPMQVQFAISYIGTLVVLASGIAIYKGHGWGRWLYIGWALLSAIIGLVTAPTMFAIMIPSLVVTAIIAFFLFRPAASAYFRGEQLSAPTA